MKYHPDRTGGVSTAKFQSIQEAYEVLKDPTLRQKWEAARSGYAQYDDFGGQRSNSKWYTNQSKDTTQDDYYRDSWDYSRRERWQ